jgi:UDP-N-acetyl-D-glucosamine dehydrogenase
VELTASELERADCVVIVTAHEDVDYRLVLEHAKIVVDTRAAISPAQRAGAKARVIAL